MDGQIDGWKNNVALLLSYHKGKPCSKFDSIPPCTLGESVMVRQTEKDVHNIPIAFFSKSMGINIKHFWLYMKASYLASIFSLNVWIDRYKQTVDPDQKPQNVASDLGLHCLALIQHF